MLLISKYFITDWAEIKFFVLDLGQVSLVEVVRKISQISKYTAERCSVGGIHRQRERKRLAHADESYQTLLAGLDDNRHTHT